VPGASIVLISISGKMLMSKKRMKLPEAMPNQEVTLKGVHGDAGPVKVPAGYS